jgi:hypothetical protein
MLQDVHVKLNSGLYCSVTFGVKHCMVLKIWTLRKVGQKYLWRFEMWRWRRKEMTIWTDRVRKEEMLRTVKEGMSYLLTPWSRVLPEKLKRPELLKKFPTFYGTRRFITAFTRARHLSLSWATLIQSMPPSNLSQVHFNIIHPSMPGSSKWSPSLRFPVVKTYEA